MRIHALFPLLFALAVALQAEPLAEPVIMTAQTETLSADEIVRRAVANDELRRQHRLALECDLTLTTTRLDAADAVLKSKTVHVIHRDGRGPAYPVDVDDGGDGDTAKAQERMASMNLRRLAPHFRFALAGEGTVRGRACYVIAFSPKAGQSAATREEKIISNLHGRYWIEKSAFEIMQGEGSLAGPVTVALLASVIRTDFRLRTQTLPNGETAPAEFDLDVAVSAPMYFYRQRQLNRLENWRPR